VGVNGRQEEVSREGLGFYIAAVSSDHDGLEWTRLGSVGGVLGRCCTLSPVVSGWLSMARWFGRGGLGFSLGVSETGLARVSPIGERARRGWLGVAR
jgi:hypothetical protein